MEQKYNMFFCKCKKGWFCELSEDLITVEECYKRILEDEPTTSEIRGITEDNAVKEMLKIIDEK